MKKRNKTAPMGAPKGMPMGRPKLKTGVLKRLLGMLVKFYPVLVPMTVVCILFTAIASAIPAVFLQ